MNSNKKITLIIFSMVTLLTLIIVALVAIGSRQSGYDSAKKRAYLTADIVKNTLTSHMINGNMNQRDVFLNSLERLRELNELWVIRSPRVSEQFGNSNFANETPRDEIDKQVLETGKEKVVVNESIKKANLRITIPYTASSADKPNCLSCHNAKEGEVLGAISLTFDIQEDRMSSIAILLNIIAIVILFLIFILIFISKKIKPYTTSFDYITEVLKQVHEGNYTIRAKEGILKEDKEAFMWLNEIIEKLETVLTGIEKNLTSFVHNRATNVNNDKLLTAKEIIEDISEIYNYKKTIETDLTKDDIYYRLIQVLKDKLEIKSFYIFEEDLQKDERKIIYAPKGKAPCCSIKKEIRELCRAQRTDNVISSETFPEVCRVASCEAPDDYTCIPFNINEQKAITIHILCEDKACIHHNKYQIGIIKKYLEETKPILESRILMDVLRERNLVDGLTGLYNRKYLDEFVDKTMPKELSHNTTYAVMFLDIDYFKMVNDTYGHDAGDAILQRLAKTMKSNITNNEFIVRFGGEEFLIVMRNPTHESAKELASRINSEFGKIVFNFNNESFSKTVSIGYAFYPEDTNQFWKCIKYADLCLYKAKETGRNRVIRFTKDILKNGEKEKY
ncbi:GGDEF domain-containing protein [Halarcobacter anaerophilus]|uniref:diguanylate cyclase n=2 Tax=Halarcobacter anaerophilus TaxID=877500 RepID=A0A4Q0XXU7_9BACT|nr:GGDEF domain-containing protein [Halarcobacter anaerophilus]QDF28145.1 diguanylate cyclase [Halarcobacter anaerophilus]RXJ62490.1 GGDEF domain-containing protein [Halarcobacter anaerophilus]